MDGVAQHQHACAECPFTHHLIVGSDHGSYTLVVSAGHLPKCIDRRFDIESLVGSQTQSMSAIDFEHFSQVIVSIREFFGKQPFLYFEHSIDVFDTPFEPVAVRDCRNFSRYQHAIDLPTLPTMAAFNKARDNFEISDCWQTGFQ